MKFYCLHSYMFALTSNYHPLITFTEDGSSIENSTNDLDSSAAEDATDGGDHTSLHIEPAVTTITETGQSQSSGMYMPTFKLQQ